MTTLIGNAKYGDIISFSVYPAAILGNNFQQVKLVGLVNAQIAETMGLNAYARHQQVYATLPKGSAPNDADQYNFIIVEMQNGQKQAIGVPWINIDTIQIFTENKVRLVLSNVPPEMFETLRAAMSANDFRIESLEVISS